MSETMTKNDLAIKLSEKHNISKCLAYDIVCDIFDMIIDSVMSGKRIEIRNFGIFLNRQTKQREGRNPQNGAKITIEPKSTIRFKVSKTISKQEKSRVLNSGDEKIDPKDPLGGLKI